MTAAFAGSTIFAQKDTPVNTLASMQYCGGSALGLSPTLISRPIPNEPGVVAGILAPVPAYSPKNPVEFMPGNAPFGAVAVLKSFNMPDFPALHALSVPVGFAPQLVSA